MRNDFVREIPTWGLRGHNALTVLKQLSSLSTEGDPLLQGVYCNGIRWIDFMIF